jgi:hypothetical protein
MGARRAGETEGSTPILLPKRAPHALADLRSDRVFPTADVPAHEGNWNDRRSALLLPQIDCLA